MRTPDGGPKFLEMLVNKYASVGNPHRVGYFIEEVNKVGRLNPGRWFRVTDKHGQFWLTPPEANGYDGPRKPLAARAAREKGKP